MTNEKAIEILKECWRYAKTYKYTDTEIREALELAIKALEHQPCEDAISREVLRKNMHYIPIAPIMRGDDVIYRNVVFSEVIDFLPSVKPQRAKGHWIEERCDMYTCSECGHIYTDLSCEQDGMNYCPNCGADMRGDEE